MSHSVRLFISSSRTDKVLMFLFSYVFYVFKSAYVFSDIDL